MPTVRARHCITETPAVAAALDAAANRWPDARDDRTELVRRLVLEGGSASTERRSVELAERRARVERFAGSLPGVDPPNALQELRPDWPERP